MKRYKIIAEVLFTAKKREVCAGFRPTFFWGGRKALGNIDQITPDSLPPGIVGKAKITIGWDWPEEMPLEVGGKFKMLEGEKEVGQGTILSFI